MEASTKWMINNLKVSLGYGGLLAKDFPAEKFAVKPFPNVSHAAFNYGHLSIYPDRLLSMLGRDDLAKPNERYAELFAAGKPCLDDPAAYPAKDEILAEMNAKYESLIRPLMRVDQSVLEQPNPNEKMRERFPTVGDLTFFLLGPHLMSHFGQVSTLRRAFGLGSVM